MAKILIVDDEKAMRQAMAQILKDEGHSIVEAGDGEQGLKIIQGDAGETLSIVIDRTQWGSINILTIALVWQKRAIPLFWSLLPKLGSSNVAEQIGAIAAILPLLKDYQVVVLGDA